MISTHTYVVTLVQGPGYVLHPKAGTITVDDGWAPHIQATLTIPIPSSTVQELLDPRVSRRITVACSAAYSSGPSTTITFDLGVRARRIDHASGEMTLTLASDEALLQDDVLLSDTPNTAGLAYQSSLRAIINNVVLSRIGASLQASPAVDSTFYVLSNSTNLITNPSLEVNSTDWVSGGNSAIGRSTAQAFVGTASLAIANSAVGLMAAAAGPSVGGAGARPVTAGKTYRFGVQLRGNAVFSAYIGLRFYDASNTQVGADVLSTASSVSTTAWQLRAVTGVAPAGATKVQPIIWGTTSTGGTLLYADAAILAEGTDAAYFDGDTPSTTDYGYAWTGTAGNSTATRTALISRSPELLNWQPGVSAWDFIQPLFRAAGFRLFCDEQRRWFLVDASYLEAGQLQLSVPTNLTEAGDEISRDNDDWFDAALVIYKWNDSTNTPQVRYDFYSQAGYTRVQTFTYERAYPGPGAASYLVRRALGKGRTMSGLAAVSRYSARPSQPVVVTLPSTPIQTGIIARVTFDLGRDEMTIDSRGLTDTPTTAWVFLAAGQKWTDSAVGASWLSETV